MLLAFRVKYGTMQFRKLSQPCHSQANCGSYAMGITRKREYLSVWKRPPRRRSDGLQPTSSVRVRTGAEFGVSWAWLGPQSGPTEGNKFVPARSQVARPVQKMDCWLLWRARDSRVRSDFVWYQTCSCRIRRLLYAGLVYEHGVQSRPDETDNKKQDATLSVWRG